MRELSRGRLQRFPEGVHSEEEEARAQQSFPSFQGGSPRGRPRGELKLRSNLPPACDCFPVPDLRGVWGEWRVVVAIALPRIGLFANFYIILLVCLLLILFGCNVEL